MSEAAPQPAGNQGAPLPRVDARLKFTGEARYAADIAGDSSVAPARGIRRRAHHEHTHGAQSADGRPDMGHELGTSGSHRARSAQRAYREIATCRTI